jgi:uncharacterized protein YebE (UPF0316 family)
LAIVVTTLAAFIFSSVWYTVFGKARMKLLGNDLSATADIRRVPTWKKLLELARTFVVTLVMAHVIALTAIVSWLDAVQLGIWIAIGFPVMILVGSVTWDKRPWQLAAIHAGDWIIKVLLMAVMLSVWR